MFSYLKHCVCVHIKYIYIYSYLDNITAIVNTSPAIAAIVVEVVVVVVVDSSAAIVYSSIVSVAVVVVVVASLTIKQKEGEWFVFEPFILVDHVTYHVINEIYFRKTNKRAL